MTPFLLDDFRTGVSALGTRWEGFSDRVMGGISDLRLGIEADSEGPYMALSGDVRLENRGGFIQARLLLKEGTSSHYDGSKHQGIRMVARGDGDGYYVFLRTTSMVFPWAFFMAPIPVTEEWSEVRIPWSAFKKGDFGAAFPLDVRKLRSLAVTAYKKAFRARLQVREIGFY
ncbi:MAG: NADH ubiquinone oxidoreductase [Treponema sp.]|nr:NADH ubiquinone oxidoreductase [Treponema sp.]